VISFVISVFPSNSSHSLETILHCFYSVFWQAQRSSSKVGFLFNPGLYCIGWLQHIDEIGFRSSFFNNEVTKLLAVVVRDVRINKDVGAVDGKAENQQHSSSLEDGRPVNFHNKKVPPVIITFAQFMAIHVYNVNTMFLRAESPEWLVHATAGEVHLDGSIVHNARTLLVNVTVAAATAKILRHAEKGDDSAQTCLGELSFGISMEAILTAQGPLSVEVCVHKWAE
jgi:hypothetical protein